MPVHLVDFYICPEPRNQHRWILVRKSDGLKLGTCGFHCWDQNEQRIEIGYDLRKVPILAQKNIAQSVLDEFFGARGR